MSFVLLDRRTLDGRLCAAAFVQNRQAFTGCADVPNPDGVSGRPWCYVESQVPSRICCTYGHGSVVCDGALLMVVVGGRRGRHVGILR